MALAGETLSSLRVTVVAPMEAFSRMRDSAACALVRCSTSLVAAMSAFSG